MTAGNGAENLSPPVSLGLGEVSIFPEAQAVKVRQEVGPEVSPEVRPDSSPPTSSPEFTSTSVLTIGPPVTVGSKRKLADSPLDSLASSPHDPNANPKGQEWTNEEDMQVMLHLRNIRQGHLSQKNMTVREAEKIQDVLKHRTVNAIKFRWNDKLKKRLTTTEPHLPLQTAQTWQETSLDPDAFFTALAPGQQAAEAHDGLSPACLAMQTPSSIPMLAALVGPASASGHVSHDMLRGHVSHDMLRDTPAASGHAVAVGQHALAAHLLAPHLFTHVLDKAWEKDKQAQAHGDMGMQHAAAQQSVGSGGSTKQLNYYTNADNIKDAMDVLVASPGSPSEHDSKDAMISVCLSSSSFGMGCESAAVKSLPHSPAITACSVSKVDSSVLDADDVCSRSMLDVDDVLHRHSTHSLCNHDVDKVDVFVDRESVSGDACAPPPLSNLRAPNRDSIVSGLI